MRFDAEQYTMLEVFIKTGGQNLRVAVDGMAKETGHLQYCRLMFPVSAGTEHTLELPEGFIGICYLSGCADIFEKGVRYLCPDGAVYDASNLSVWNENGCRNIFHFMPFTGWMNDPNGLCFFGGYYHLFYQMNPFGQEWDNMFWGHAVSKDLIRWVHLPIALEAQPELASDSRLKGGAFSGCAVVHEKRMRLFFTRHFEIKENGTPPYEYQAAAESADGLSITAEHPVIMGFPEGASHDFRDPKIDFIDGAWYMALGSRYNSVPSVLLYSSENLENWSFRGALLSDSTDGGETMECPDFFKVDGVYVLAASLMPRSDIQRKFIRMRYYAGSFADGKLACTQKGLCDFGPDYYAAQSFEHDGRRIVIGWLSDYYREHIQVKDGVNGSMGIPREIHFRNGKLLQTPVGEVYSLIGDRLYSGGGEACECGIPGGAAYISCIMTDDSDFTVFLGSGISPDGNKTSISLIRKDGTVKIVTEGLPSSRDSFESAVKHVRSLEIFSDRRCIEVFVNGGEDVGSKVFYRDGCGCMVKASFANGKAISKFEIYAVRSAWR